MLDEIIEILTKTPAIKAKVIAKKLDVSKKEVNSLLHANIEKFSKDDEFKWSIANSSNLKIELEGDCWVNCSSFENSLLDSGSPLDLNVSSVTFVIPKDCKILLDASARLLALCNQVDKKGTQVIIDFSDCRQTLSFFNRIGFIDQLNEGVSVLPERPDQSTAVDYKGNNSSLVEYGPVDPSQMNKELMTQLTDCFIELSDEKYEMAASTVFSELIGNIKEHSESPLFGFAALQLYRGKRKHIQTVISDSGLGIAKTLRPSLKEHHPNLYKRFGERTDKSDADLVKEVLSKGEISRFGTGRGLGFYSSRKQAVKFNAKYSVRQEIFCLDFIYENGELDEVIEHHGLTKIHGTHLCFDFYID